MNLNLLDSESGIEALLSHPPPIRETKYDECALSFKSCLTCILVKVGARVHIQIHVCQDIQR